jgi:chromosome segregation ATPase
LAQTVRDTHSHSHTLHTLHTRTHTLSTLSPGTGKSTIISGICLGLAGPTRLLGRQSAVGDFVKTGEDSGTIELELCRHSEENLVIERTITKTNQSTWKMNGRQTSESKVKEEIRRLNIQIDNLCQFLPQDKVPEFAKMNKVELLQSTERAVGGEDMVKRHEELIELSKAEGEVKKSLDDDIAHKDKLDK